MYVYCVVCYRVIVAPYVRRVGHVFSYLYTLDDDSERPMDYKTSLLTKVFPLRTTVKTHDTTPYFSYLLLLLLLNNYQYNCNNTISSVSVDGL